MIQCIVYSFGRAPNPVVLSEAKDLMAIAYGTPFEAA